MAERRAGLILAGGRSSRMGRPKPLIEIGGRRVIERVVEALAPCVDELVVSTNDPDLYAFLGLPLIPDAAPGRGPLGGIHAASKRLAACATVLVVAADYPFLEIAALERIGKEEPLGGVVLPRIERRLHPLCAHYACSALETIGGALANGELMVLSLVARLRQSVLEEEVFGPRASRIFFNVNTPEDLEAAERMLGQAQPRG